MGKYVEIAPDFAANEDNMFAKSMNKVRVSLSYAVVDL